MIKSKVFLVITFLLILIVSALYAYSYSIIRPGIQSELNSKRELVDRLQLTDFAIWTEARYTRHPSQADLFSPFQDLPASLEHFPAGSIIAPVTIHADKTDQP